jgi:hypothetical protein
VTLKLLDRHTHTLTHTHTKETYCIHTQTRKLSLVSVHSTVDFIAIQHQLKWCSGFHFHAIVKKKIKIKKKTISSNWVTGKTKHCSTHDHATKKKYQEPIKYVYRLIENHITGKHFMELVNLTAAWEWGKTLR